MLIYIYLCVILHFFKIYIILTENIFYKKKKMISLSTANRILNKFIGKLRVIRKIFHLKPLKI